MTHLTAYCLDTATRRLARWAVTTALVLGLAACAVPGPRPGDAPPAASEVSDAGGADTGGPLSPRAVLYKLLVAEFAGHRGRLDLSVSNYLEVAKATREPSVVERAVRIAVYARDDQSALEGATLWTEIAPESHEARRVLATLYLRTGRLDDAVREIDKLVQSLEINTAQAYALVVDMLGRERDKEQALEVMRKYVAGRDGDPMAQLAYAKLAVRAQDHDLAAELLSGVLAGDPQNREALLLHASVLQHQGKSAEAIDVFGRLLALEPGNAKIRTAYARLLVNAKRFDEALKEFRSLTLATPANSDVRFAYALLLLQTNRLDEAAKQFERLLADGEREQPAHFYLGQIAEVGEDFASAIEHYTQVDGGQHYLDAQIRKAVLFARQGDLTRAREQLHGISTDNQQEATRLYLVETELQADAGLFEEALATFDRALEEYPEDTDLLYSRAMLGEKMGRIDILERDLRSVLAREPDNAQALNALGYTLADRTGRHAEALELIAKALKLKPDDYYILDSMGWVLYRLGRIEEALGYLRRAVELNNDPEIAAHLGEVLWVMGDRSGARQVWESALKDTPDDKHLLEVMERFKP